MPPDDDIHYTLIGLAASEEFGGDFSWQDVAYMDQPLAFWHDLHRRNAGSAEFLAT